MDAVFHPRHRLPVRMADRLIEGMRAAGLKRGAFSAEKMMRQAELTTGLCDWGDRAFETPLRLLMDDINDDRDLSETGRLFHRFYILIFLRNRLKLIEALKRYPEAKEETIAPPLVILGLPRTATSRLFNILSGDPRHRTLTYWEATNPVAPASEHWLPFNPRRAIGAMQLKSVDFLAPEFKAIHELYLDGPEECIHLFGSSLVSWIIPVEYNAPRYIKWFCETDHLEPYREFKAQLQLLQLQKETGRWVLKSPHHLFGIEALMKTFPNAKVIQTHRDPVKVVPSCCSLARSSRGIACHTLDLHHLGAQMMDELATGLNRTVTFRPNLPENQVIDIQYREIVTDPLDAVRRIYQKFGLSMTSEAEAGIDRKIGEKTHNKHGKHSYSAAEFGLSRDRIEERFSDYCSAFDVERED